jgi:hypothetical protein
MEMHPMKLFVFVLAMFCATAGWAADKPMPAQPAASAPIKGVVLETMDVDIYTYVRLKTASGETWAAVPKVPVTKGAEVTIENPMIMDNFESKTLKRKFDRIVFGTLGGKAPAAASAAGPGDMGAMHAGVAKAPAMGDVKVPKASGPNAQTVAEIVTKGSQLKDKPVLVRGKVVKYNAGIMGKNWIHLRDGTGAEADRTNDVLVTTLDEVKLGDVVTLKGTVRTDRDLGSGYSYKVLVEEATLQK